jgi:hypothetical protein
MARDDRATCSPSKTSRKHFSKSLRLSREVAMSFVLNGLSPDTFRTLFAQSDDDLRIQRIRRMTVDAEHGYPCRVSLQEGAPGEEVLLLPYAHQPADSPYHASGPIFVRRAALAPARIENDIPSYLASRLLSIRAYDSGDAIIDAEVCEGSAARATIERLLDNRAAAYLHVHFARYGCFGCRVDRA